MISKIGTGISVLAVIGAFAWSPYYLVELGACFLFFLFAFHWAFGARSGLTVTQARMIDYIYLGTAAIGVFLLALNYEEKRYEYVQLETQDKIRKQLEKSQVDLAEGVQDLQRAACIPVVVQVMPQYCDRAKKLGLALAVEDKSETNKNYSVAVTEYLNDVAPPDLDDYGRQLYRRIEAANQELKSRQLSVKIDLLSIEFQAPMPPDDIRNTTFGLFLWPFVLAFAFALRITKTTIEVLDWAKSK